jgi:3-hydroxymyristoyl/3-hydroxydecanoyl-(acyl carrier protein) dehydratase
MTAIPTPAHVLPHAFPFILVDRILLLEPDRWVVTVKNITRNDPLVDARGHLPPSLVAEVMAQTAGLAMIPPAVGGATVLARLHRFRCRPPLRSGDQLVVTVRVVRRLGSGAKVRASIRVAGRYRAAAELVLYHERALAAGDSSGAT